MSRGVYISFIKTCSLIHAYLSRAKQWKLYRFGYTFGFIFSQLFKISDFQIFWALALLYIDKLSICLPDAVKWRTFNTMLFSTRYHFSNSHLSWGLKHDFCRFSCIIFVITNYSFKLVEALDFKTPDWMIFYCQTYSYKYYMHDQDETNWTINPKYKS